MVIAKSGLNNGPFLAMTTSAMVPPRIRGKRNGQISLGRSVMSTEFASANPTASEPTHSWRQKDGVLYFSVTSDGTTGGDWITRLENKRFRVDDDAKQVLRSPDFKPTRGVTTDVAVLKRLLFMEDELTIGRIRAEAYRRKLIKTNAEVACLTREKFTDRELQDMVLRYITFIHEPISNSYGDPRLLTVPIEIGGCLLTQDGGPDKRWYRDFGGFAFAVSQSSQH